LTKIWISWTPQYYTFEPFWSKEIFGRAFFLIPAVRERSIRQLVPKHRTAAELFRAIAQIVFSPIFTIWFFRIVAVSGLAVLNTLFYVAENVYKGWGVVWAAI
jgi:hypothetical protein